tara:strand:- start:486 stop:809 length:324 start_codon:yes stop_codon:yes gene_type:complete
MNEAIVRGIYGHVGTEKLKAISLPADKKPKRDTDERPISVNTIDLIQGIIKKYKNPTRRTVIAKSFLSPSTVNNAIRILSGRGLIIKTKSEVGSGRTVSYSLVKKSS